jgi:lysozyme
MEKIIDVSSHNGKIDWRQVVNDGVTDVIIRLSLGYHTKDKMAATYAEAASKSGIAVSYYHFAYPDKKTGGTVDNDARKEARSFTGLFHAGLMPPPRWLALDLEKWEEGKDSPLNKKEYLKWVAAFLDEVYTTTGKGCLLYSNKPYLESHLPASHRLGKIPLWIANYNPLTSPPLPKGWTNYFLWQFTDVGKVRGIKGYCDLNKLHFETLMLSVAEESESPGNIQASLSASSDLSEAVRY